MARRVVNEHRLSEIDRAKTARNPVPLLENVHERTDMVQRHGAYRTSAV
jgi:hypothetical protein